ncbi:ACT domain-containing protein [Olsenella massiliensis]|uniref:ACT domain-containing protein n=1 Tax=Olsenella massiliensis TaxID=1622075 RepID=UPI00071D49B0|nr:ACT domain-containing protein [Olsenella massiliensis]
MSETGDTTNNRAIVTVLGNDRPGIVAAVTGALAECDINILDISQTILQGIFTMTMLVDLAGASVEFRHVQDRLDRLAQDLCVQVNLQREDVFNYMYRL